MGSEEAYSRDFTDAGFGYFFGEQEDLGPCERSMLFTIKWRRWKVECLRDFGMHIRSTSKGLWIAEPCFSEGIVEPLSSENLQSSQLNIRKIWML